MMLRGFICQKSALRICLIKSETKRSLQETGVTEVILFLGACDKQNQKSLVALFMDGDARDAAKYGAGA